MPESLRAVALVLLSPVTPLSLAANSTGAEGAAGVTVTVMVLVMVAWLSLTVTVKVSVPA